MAQVFFYFDIWCIKYHMNDNPFMVALTFQLKEFFSAYQCQHKSAQIIVKSLAKTVNASYPNIKPSAALPGIV